MFGVATFVFGTIHTVMHLFNISTYSECLKLRRLTTYQVLQV